jgi:hypothetical protein
MCRAMTGEKPPVAAERIDEDEFVCLSYRALPNFSDNFRRAIDLALGVRAQDRTKTVFEFRAQLSSASGTAVTKMQEKTDQRSDQKKVTEPLLPEPLPQLPNCQVANASLSNRLVPAITAAVIALLVLSAFALWVAKQRVERFAQQAAEEQEKKSHKEARVAEAARQKAEVERLAAQARKEAEAENGAAKARDAEAARQKTEAERRAAQARKEAEAEKRAAKARDAEAARQKAEGEQRLDPAQRAIVNDAVQQGLIIRVGTNLYLRTP